MIREALASLCSCSIRYWRYSTGSMLYWRCSTHGASRLQLAVLRHQPLQLRRQRAATATQRAAADGGGGAGALMVARRAAQQRAWLRFGLGLGFGLSLSPSPSPSPSPSLTLSRSRWLAATGPGLSPTPPEPPAPNVWQRLSRPARKYASVAPDTRGPERAAPDGGAETQGRPPPAEETLPKRTRQG